jgi:hypothetical protein
MHGNSRVSFRFVAVFVANSRELTSTPLSVAICEFTDMIRCSRIRTLLNVVIALIGVSSGFYSPNCFKRGVAALRTYRYG